MTVKQGLYYPGQRLSVTEVVRMASDCSAQATGTMTVNVHTWHKGKALFVLVRQISIHLSHVVAGRSQDDVAKGFRRDRATVNNALRVIEALRDCDSFDLWLERLEFRFSKALELADTFMRVSEWRAVLEAISDDAYNASLEGESLDRAEYVREKIHLPLVAASSVVKTGGR